jgi:hypothetical protein
MTGEILPWIKSISGKGSGIWSSEKVTMVLRSPCHMTGEILRAFPVKGLRYGLVKK